MHYLHPQLQELIVKQSWIELDSNTAFFLNSKLLSFPFLGSGIEWGAIPNHKTLNRVGISDAAECQWLVEQTAFGTHDYAVVLYGAKEIPLMGNRDSVLANLDMIFWKAPGQRYVFAADYVKLESAVIPFAVLEYGTGDVVRVAELPIK